MRHNEDDVTHEKGEARSGVASESRRGLRSERKKDEPKNGYRVLRAARCCSVGSKIRLL